MTRRSSSSEAAISRFLQDALESPLGVAPPLNEAQLQQRFVRLARRAFGGSDVAAMLSETHGATRLDDYGTPPPAGTYALETLPFVGPLQTVFSMIMSCLVVRRSERSTTYLGKMAQECKRREQRLAQALQTADAEGKTHTAAKLRQDLAGLRAFKASVEAAQRHAWQDWVLPGGARFFGASSVMGLAIDRAPTLLGTGALAPSVAGAVLGGVGGGLLSVFGLFWLARNARGAYRAWRTPCYDVDLVQQVAPEMQEFLRACNKHQRVRRAYYMVNTAASMAYVGSQLTLAVASSGMSVPAAMVPLLAGASATSFITELRWGARCGSHNASTPHNDRIALQRIEARSATWRLLQQQKNLQKTTRRQLVEHLPAHRSGRRLSFKSPWLLLSKRTRYGLWRRIGAGGRLGAWCVRDPAVADAALRDLMAATNELEAQALRQKLQDTKRRLEHCQREYDADDPLVNEYLHASARAYDDDLNRLRAMQSLQTQLDTFDTVGLRDAVPRRIAWNRLKMGYLAAHGLLYHFFTYSLVRKHPKWFQCSVRRSTILGRQVVTQVRLAEDGLEQAAREFDATMEKEFANLLLGPELNRYERHALLGLDADARSLDMQAVRDQLLATLAEEPAAA